MDYILVPRSWQTRAVVAQNRLSDHFLVTAAIVEHTAEVKRARWKGWSLTGWKPKTFEDGKKFRRRIADTFAELTKGGGLIPMDEAGREIVGAAESIEHTTTQKRSAAVPKPEELWNLETAASRCWGAKRCEIMKEATKIRRRYRADKIKAAVDTQKKTINKY